jgi:hypothetical protein
MGFLLLVFSHAIVTVVWVIQVWRPFGGAGYLESDRINLCRAWVVCRVEGFEYFEDFCLE